MRPYSVRMPPFDPTSGGIRVCWGLYGWLLAKGQIVFPNATYENKNFVAIYPEIYHGNDMGAEIVVRYILNKPGVMGSFDQYGIFTPGPTEFEPTDRIYVFSRIYDTFGVDDNLILFLPILNLHLFKDQKRRRRNRCVYVGKGKDLPLKETEGLLRITKKIALDQQSLADYLNTCDVMYSFENPTAMNEIARLCGCRVIFIPEGATTNFTKEELEEKYEPSMMGISWGLDDYQPLDVDAFRQHYINLQKEFERKLDIFIEETQK